MRLTNTNVKTQTSQVLVHQQAFKSMNGSSQQTAVKAILITQAKPENDKNPYTDLAKKFGLTIEFKPFIHLEPLTAKEFRKWKINPVDYTAVVFTSRGAVDQFFKLC